MKLSLDICYQFDIVVVIRGRLFLDLYLTRHLMYVIVKLGISRPNPNCGPIGLSRSMSHVLQHTLLLIIAQPLKCPSLVTSIAEICSLSTKYQH